MLARSARNRSITVPFLGLVVVQLISLSMRIDSIALIASLYGSMVILCVATYFVLKKLGYVTENNPYWAGCLVIMMLGLVVWEVAYQFLVK